MTQSWYNKHRPTTFKGVYGQSDAIRVLTDAVKRKAIPHAILLTGPSGCGKTTCARILKDKLGCGDMDFVELNCADFRGIDTARDISRTMSLSPMSGPCRVFILDEVHQASKDMQSAMLKVLEDTPKHVYFFLCTTDPQKILKTIVTRCTEVRLNGIPENTLQELVQSVADAEKVKISTELRDKIAEVADGSARKAIVLLEQVSGIEDEQEQLDSVQKSNSNKQAIDLCRAIMKHGAKWQEVRSILKDVIEEPESIRRMILSYASSMLLNKDDKKAYLVLTCFEGHFYDSGRAGLIRACYEVFSHKE